VPAVVAMLTECSREGLNLPSESYGVQKLWVDGGNPRPLLGGSFFVDEDDSGDRSWEAHLFLRGWLDDVLEDECSVMFELHDGQKPRGRASISDQAMNTPPDETRCLLRGAGPLTGFDWSVLDG
jgi:hypothetical protein